jgi:hypothetical protein
MAEYKKLIEAEIQRLIESMLTKGSIQDFPAFKNTVGVIEGLKKALEYSDEADAIANGRE